MSRSNSCLRTSCFAVCLSGLIVACGGSSTTDPPGNGAPVSTTAPDTTAEHNRAWSYSIGVSDPEGDAVTVEAIGLPSWITFDAAGLTLSGTAGFGNLGAHTVTLRAFDGTNERRQHFTLAVVPGEIFCDQDFGDSLQSPYILPWRPGLEFELQQGNCSAVGGHVNWFAYDFDLATGDTIIASRAGTVVAVREQSADGTRICGQQQENLVFVEHADHTIMAYMHLTTNGALVEVGDDVAQGEAIGLSGDSGCSAGPHLHVALFAAQRTGFDRQFSLPVNYSNASGVLDGQRQLVPGQRYRALP